MGNNKKLTTTLVILVVLGLVFMLLSGYATIFTALTMYVFASICIVLTVTTSKSKKQYSRRVDDYVYIHEHCACLGWYFCSYAIIHNNYKKIVIIYDFFC